MAKKKTDPQDNGERTRVARSKAVKIDDAVFMCNEAEVSAAILAVARNTSVYEVLRRARRLDLIDLDGMEREEAAKLLLS